MNTEFENNANDAQLQDMRQQMDTLKKKLDKQTIVSDRYIRQSMNRTAGKISHRYRFIMTLCIIMIPYTYFVFVSNLGLSFLFWIGTCILMLACFGATYYNWRNVKDPNLMSNNLVEVSQKMANAKKFDANWLFFGIPAVIVWLAWLTWEMYQQDSEVAHAMLIGTICGATIGAIWGFSMHFQTQRQYQKIIDTIEDITADE